MKNESLFSCSYRARQTLCLFTGLLLLSAIALVLRWLLLLIDRPISCRIGLVSTGGVLILAEVVFIAIPVCVEVGRQVRSSVVLYLRRPATFDSNRLQNSR